MTPSMRFADTGRGGLLLLTRRIDPGIGAAPGVAAAPGIPTAPGVAAAPGIAAAPGVTARRGVTAVPQQPVTQLFDVPQQTAKDRADERHRRDGRAEAADESADAAEEPAGRPTAGGAAGRRHDVVLAGLWVVVGASAEVLPAE